MNDKYKACLLCSKQDGNVLTNELLLSFHPECIDQLKDGVRKSFIEVNRIIIDSIKEQTHANKNNT